MAVVARLGSLGRMGSNHVQISALVLRQSQQRVLFTDSPPSGDGAGDTAGEGDGNGGVFIGNHDRNGGMEAERRGFLLYNDLRSLGKLRQWRRVAGSQPLSKAQCGKHGIVIGWELKADGFGDGGDSVGRDAQHEGNHASACVKFLADSGKVIFLFCIGQQFELVIVHGLQFFHDSVLTFFFFGAGDFVIDVIREFVAAVIA